MAARKAAGDTGISLVEGWSLLGPADGDCLVDGQHVNDLGFQRMAERLSPILRAMLGLAAPGTGSAAGAAD